MNIIIVKLKMVFIRAYTRIYGLFHPIEKKILFLNYGGAQYSDNPRAIAEKMNEIDPSFQIVWKLNQIEDEYSIIPSFVNKKKLAGLAFYRELATSCCVVNNECFEPNFSKRKGQLFIQTWHGDRGFKYILYDAWENGKRPIPIIDNSITDYCIAGSEFGEDTYRTAFNSPDNIIKIGSPRNDKLLNCSDEEKLKIKESLGIIGDKCVLLYAPTYRDNSSNTQSVNVNLTEVLKLLEYRTKSEWVCLLRAHSASKGLNYDESNSMINATRYPDMTDLLCIADLLITDYSSSACDLSITEKPSILALFDYEEYQAECRKLRVDPRTVGFCYAENQTQLNDIIKNTPHEEFVRRNKLVNDYYKVFENGTASETICHIIIDSLNV